MEAPSREPVRPPYEMPAHRRLMAWLVTDRPGQGLALALLFAWALALYARGRLRRGNLRA